MWKKITLENISYDGKIDEVLKPLVGYEVKIQIEGEHINDSQMVDYGFSLKIRKVN